MNNPNNIRVLVVDDTIVYRKIVSDVLSEIPGIEVVGTANNGKIAMSRIVSMRPDLITLDIEMPEMNGLEVLAEMQKVAPDVGAIMLSTLTHEGGDMTIKALELGAFDFIPKPQSGTMGENRKLVKSLIVPMLKAFTRRQEIKNILRGNRPPPKPREAEPAKTPKTENLTQRMERISSRITPRAEVVAIGISTGGPNALAHMMPKIPDDIGVPILIVQHMPPIFTQSLAKSLNAKCPIEIREAEDGEPLLPNTVLIAPGGKQMKVSVSTDNTKKMIKITDDPPENSCKPSVDYLFRSIAQNFGNRATGVIMTGMGMDGTLGAQLIKNNNSFIIAQDETTCTVFGMPKEPILKGIVDVIAPLDRIAREITKTVKGSR